MWFREIEFSGGEDGVGGGAWPESLEPWGTATRNRFERAPKTLLAREDDLPALEEVDGR